VANGELVDAIKRSVQLPKVANMKVANPGPGTGEVGNAPISATTPEWSIESNHRPRDDAPAIQSEPGAVVEPWCDQPSLMPLSSRQPLSHAAFCTSVRTTQRCSVATASARVREAASGRRVLSLLARLFAPEFWKAGGSW
jgi:hypothetical protein